MTTAAYEPNQIHKQYPMKTAHFFSWLITILLSVTTTSKQATTLGQDTRNRFQLADGLTIHPIASDIQTPDCTCLAIDKQDHIFAAGPGYLRMLSLEADGKGVRTITNVTQSIEQAAQGLWIDNQSIYYVADGGVWQIELSDTFTQTSPNPIKHIDLPTGGEHQGHAIRKGNDDYWYLIVGNACDSMISLQNTSTPIIRNPRAGMIWRFSNDWKERSIVAHGLRNAYDFDFIENGNIITYDSDGERDISLPWYRPTRVFEMTTGSDAGWVTRSWKRPNHDPSMPKVIAELGRGSPTGVKRSKGNRLPKRFHRGTFVLDWTFGRIVFVSDQGETELIAQPADFSGFPVTDIETLQDGRLIVSVGGRGSHGGIYMIDAAPGDELDQSDPIRSSPKNIASKEALSSPEESPATASEIRQLISQLRDQPQRAVSIDAAEIAICRMEQNHGESSEWIEPLTLLVESVGGLGQGDPKDARGTTQVAAVFDGYRSVLRPQISPAQMQRATEILLRQIPQQRSQSSVHTEMIRTLAVLEPDNKLVIDLLLKEINWLSDPIGKLHCLIAIARIPAKRNDEQTESIAVELLKLVRQVRHSNLNTDRHWPLRLAELFDAMQYRDSLLPSRIVAQSDLGDPADLVWMENMDPENLERARQKLLATEQSRNHEDIALFIALGDDAVPRPIMRQWLTHDQTRQAGIIALTNDARISDAELLYNEAWSSDSLVRERVRAALKRLELEIPDRPQQTQSVASWEKRSESILQIRGNKELGSQLYASKQCKKCHDGNRALGPRLEGVAKRYSSNDLLKAVYDPSHTIPDRYRARIIISHDQERIVGIPIYESVDGLTLVTASGETLRVEKDEIDEIKNSSLSTMPEGLLDGLSDKDVASLLSFLQSQ